MLGMDKLFQVSQHSIGTDQAEGLHKKMVGVLLLDLLKAREIAGAETKKPDPFGGRSRNGLCLEQKPEGWLDLA
jgi:hypothetical protein